MLLLSAMTGFNVTVRPLTPPVMGMGLWYDASDATSITIATGVSQWSDKSGNGRHLTQATGGNQPALNANGLNGLPYVSFDGTNDYMTATWASVTNPITVCAVARLRANTAFAAPMGILGNGGLGTSLDPLDLSASGNTYRMLASAVLSGGAGGATNNVWYYFTSVLNGASSLARASNVSTISTGDTGSSTASNLTIGADPGFSVFFPIDAAEILYYPSALSAADYGAVEGYLKAKWGV
jgi:hypothetical protein